MIRLLVFDLETTGLRTDKDRIVEIAAVMQDQDGHELLRYSSKINPGMHIGSRASEVHGIMDADVLTARPFSEIAPSFVRLMEAADIVGGHNIVGFDVPLLLAELARVGAAMPKRSPEILDTTTWRWATADGKMPTLQELCWALNVDYDPTLAHRALYDVIKNAECIQSAIKLGLYAPKQTEPLVALAA